MDSDKKSIIRAKSTISFEALQNLMKEHIAEPTDEWMEIEDDSLIIKLYLHFFVALAQQTTRVNAVAVAQIANRLWKMGMHKATLFGKAMQGAFSYAKKAGDNAITGTKLTTEVWHVYIAMTGKWPGKSEAVTPVKVAQEEATKKPVPMKTETMTPLKVTKAETVVQAELGQGTVVKAELGHGKEELAQSKAQPWSSRCLTSPKKIMQLYQVQFSSSKDPAAESSSKKVKVDIQKCVDIYIYVYM